MNRADVQMLNGQLDELGNSFVRNRAIAEQKTRGDEELDVKKQQLATDQARTGVDQSFRDAQMAHYNTMEKLNAGNEATKLNQQDVANKQQMLSTAIALNATGALDPDALDSVNEWLADDDHFKQSGIQIQKPTDPKTTGKDAAVVNALKYADSQDELAQSDPDNADQYTANAKMARGWVGKQNQFKPPEGYQQTQVKPTYNLNGKQTGSVTNTTTRTPISAPIPTPAAAPAATPPMVRVIHPLTKQTGTIPAANLQNALSQGYQLMPQQQVSGFGAAQPGAQ